MSAEPSVQDVPAGGSAVYKIFVYPQGDWREGSVSFELVDPPEGVTAVFVPDTVEFVDVAQVIMIVEVATDTSQGNVTLKVVASGRECCSQGSGKNVGSDVKIKLTVSGSVEIEEPDELEQVKTVTVTITSYLSDPIPPPPW